MTETEGWRRVWPFTHSDLSSTGADLRRDAEAIAFFALLTLLLLLLLCYLISSPLGQALSLSLLTTKALTLYIFIYSCLSGVFALQRMANMRLPCADQYRSAMWMITC